MTENEIFDALLEILKNEIGLNDEITSETSLLEHSILDSMDFINYIARVEKKYNLKITSAEIESYKLGIMKNMIKFLEDRSDK